MSQDPRITGEMSFLEHLEYTLAKDKYSASRNDSTITVLGAGADSVLAKVPTGRLPNAMLYNSREDRLYCANEESNSVSVIDGSTDRGADTSSCQAISADLFHKQKDLTGGDACQVGVLRTAIRTCATSQ